MKNRFFALAAALMLALLAGCAVTATSPDPTPEPTPEATPTPFVEPVLEAFEAVTVDGKELKSGSFIADGTQFVLLSEFCEAVNAEMTADGNGAFSFPWRKSTVELSADAAVMRYLDTERTLDAAPLLCRAGEDMYVPVKSLCDGAEIGLLYDEEYSMLYCTPAAGNWEIPQGYTVPVFMYHATGHAPDDANLFVDKSSLIEQFDYLRDNGYTPIGFEDLWHVEDFEKPVILTFDDGWANNYTVLFPLLKEYNFKATVFIVEKFIHRVGGNHMDECEVIEMAESGLVSIQSHTVTHDKLQYMSEEEQRYQMEESRRYITRLVGRQPLTLCYPSGSTNDLTYELTREYYHFGVKMIDGSVYNTSCDPVRVWRFFPQRNTYLGEYISWLQQAFPEG